MTFFTLLYHSGDDGAVVVPPAPPAGSGPGQVGGYEPEHDRRRRLAEKRKRFDNVDKFFSDRNRYVPPDPDGDSEPRIINPPVMAEVSYENVARRIEIAARAATAERMRLLRQKQMMIDDEEAIALLLLMN